MYELNKELKLLLLSHHEDLLRLSRAKAKAERLGLLEKVITTFIQSDALHKEQDIDNVSHAFSTLATESQKWVDTYVLQEQKSKTAVQAFLDSKLSSLKFLQQQPPKKSPVEAIHVGMLKGILNTLFKYDIIMNQNGDNSNIQEWITKVSTAYLHMCPIQGLSFLIQHLVHIRHISTWAIPLIQLNYNNFTQIAHGNNYTMLLALVFDKEVVWTEDDYLAVLDQMDMVTTCSGMMESASIEDVLSFSKQVMDIILVPLERRASFRNLSRRLSQITTQLAQLVYDKAGDTEEVDQGKLDDMMKEMIYTFADIERVPVGWSSLPNVPFMALSMKALWEVTCSLLSINSETTSQYLPHLLEHPPDTSAFQKSLNENQTQGFFLMSCLVNIATCIPPGVDDISQLDRMALACVTVISHALFMTAFVNEALRDIYYKDVRDGFGVVCSNHAFVTSLLFRWTVHHISLMEGMSIYLFRSLPLHRWVILRDDLVLLNSLFTNDETKGRQIQFAKYIVENLNFEYRNDSRDDNLAKSQPWAKRKLPFLGYDIHEDIAFMLLDACHKFQPLLTETGKKSNGGMEMVGAVVSSAVNTYMPLAEQVLLFKLPNAANTSLSKHQAFIRDFMKWAWKMVLRIKLYDCPVSSRAADIEKSINLPFLRLILNSNTSEESTLHASLLVYVSFMLTTTSRHFLRFESGNGWMKLLVILRRGKPDAVIHALCEMIPSFVYMHGDDFFNDESLSDLLIHMTQLKTDPGLVNAAKDVVKTKHDVPYYGTCGINLVIGSTIWQSKFIDDVSQLMEEGGAGFSYLDLVLHSWLKTLLRKPDWMWDTYCVAMVDCVCKIAFSLGNRVAYKMFIEEHKRMEATKNQNQANSQRITRFFNSVISGDGFPSLLVGEWSVLNIKANTFYKTPGIEKQQFWFAFEVLLMETVEEQAQREEIAKAIGVQMEKLLPPADNTITTTTDMNANANTTTTTTPVASPTTTSSTTTTTTTTTTNLDIAPIHKALNIPHKKPLEFFSIYRWAQHILVLPLDHPLLILYLQVFFTLYYESTSISTSENKTQQLVYGYTFFNKKPELISKLRDTIANIQTHYGQKMANLGHGSQAQADAYSLQQTYYSMWLWLGQTDILKSDFKPTTLPQHYSVPRLLGCYNTTKQPWHDFQLFWMDLVDMDDLEHSFLEYPWESSEKFQRVATPDDISSNLDTISLFRTQRYTPHQSTVVNLPSLDTALPAAKRNR
ncbi:hypothetical protein K501DRAFT_337119 [Backusella circina FSU 941]|nr:hypothetical protein K501DRAFT_337119 [Backusella circina FSU 941]